MGEERKGREGKGEEGRGRKKADGRLALLQVTLLFMVCTTGRGKRKEEEGWD
jgi:hypothetical protein